MSRLIPLAAMVAALVTTAASEATLACDASPYDCAIAHNLKAAVRLSPAQASFHAALGQLLAETQQLQPAVESLRKLAIAQRLNPALRTPR